MVASLGLGNGKLREFKVLFWEIMLLAAKAIFIYSLVHRMTVHTRESCSCCSAYLCSRKQVQLCGTKTMKERKKEREGYSCLDSASAIGLGCSYQAQQLWLAQFLGTETKPFTIKI